MSHLSSAWDISPPYQCHRRILDRNINCLRSFDRIFLYLGMTQSETTEGGSISHLIVLWSWSSWSSSLMIVLCYTWVCARSTETSQEEKTGCNYYCICASQLQPSKTQPRWVFQSALLFWNHLKITYAPSLRKFDNSTREFILQNKWPLSLFGWSRDTTSLMCLKIDTSPPFSAKG